MPDALTRYRQLAARRMPLGVLAILVVWWLGSTVATYRTEPDPAEQTIGAYRMANAAWSVATELEDDPKWLQYFLLFDTSQGTKESCVRNFEKLREAELLSIDGEQSLRIMKSLAETETDPVPPSDTVLSRWQQSSTSHGGWAWEMEALQRHFEDEPPPWAVSAIRLEKDSRQSVYRLWIAAAAIWFAAFLVGLPYLPAALNCFKSEHRLPPSPTTRCWHPLWILGLVLIAINGSDWFFTLAYGILPIPESWEGSLFETVLFDGIWRFIGPALLAVAALAVWHHGARILQLHRPPQFRPILGMLPLVVVYDLVLWKAFDLANLTDWSDIVYLDEDGMTGLVYAIISGVIFAPLAEEICFRGFLFQSLERRSGFWPATLISTLFFAMIHFYGIHGTLSVASFGIVACALYRATGSLWTPIIYHALTNGLITASTWPLYNAVYSN